MHTTKRPAARLRIALPTFLGGHAELAIDDAAIDAAELAALEARPYWVLTTVDEYEQTLAIAAAAGERRRLEGRGWEVAA